MTWFFLLHHWLHYLTAAPHQAGAPGGVWLPTVQGDETAVCGRLQHSPADLLVATLGCRAQAETLSPITLMVGGTDTSQRPENSRSFVKPPLKFTLKHTETSQVTEREGLRDSMVTSLWTLILPSEYKCVVSSIGRTGGCLYFQAVQHNQYQEEQHICVVSDSFNLFCHKSQQCLSNWGMYGTPRLGDLNTVTRYHRNYKINVCKFTSFSSF